MCIVLTFCCNNFFLCNDHLVRSAAKKKKQIKIIKTFLNHSKTVYNVLFRHARGIYLNIKSASSSYRNTKKKMLKKFSLIFFYFFRNIQKAYIILLANKFML